MKTLIELSGKSLKEFSRYYKIPYNTVRQWYNGDRVCPDYVRELLKKDITAISKKHYYFEVFDVVRCCVLRQYLCDSEEKRDRMIKINTGVTKDTIIIKRDFVETI